MQKYILLFAIIFFLACKQSNKQMQGDLRVNEMHVDSLVHERVQTYIHHPRKDDFSCLNELKQAEEDLKKGNLTYCLVHNFSAELLKRHDEEIKEICEKKKLKVKDLLLSCIVTAGDYDPDACYCAFMDSILTIKLGKNFKKEIELEADSFFNSKQKK